MVDSRICCHTEILQVIIDEIDGDGVAVVVQCEEGFRKRDILEIVAHGLSLHHGKWQDDEEEEYDELFHFLFSYSMMRVVGVAVTSNCLNCEMRCRNMSRPASRFHFKCSRK